MNILFSLRTAFVLFLLLAALFGAGSRLSNLADIKPLLEEMTATHIWHALPAILNTPLLLSWLLALGLVAVALFVNTLCCTLRQIDRYLGWMADRGGAGRKRLQSMAVIHILALLVIVFHALDVGFVQRHEPVDIPVGDQAQLGEYLIRVDAVDYVTDRKFIREKEDGSRLPSFRIPASAFSINGNRAQLSIYKNGALLRRTDIALFAPLRLGANFFILDGFYIPHNSNQPGISLHRSFNPLALPFFTLYSVLFCALLWHGLRHRYRARNPQSEES